MLGYHDDPEGTAAALSPDGWLRTHDEGYCDADGWFYFVDRAVNVIKRAGENVSTTEVECVLTSHPLIAEAAVVGVPDPVRDKAVKAYVRLQPGAQLGRLGHRRALPRAARTPQGSGGRRLRRRLPAYRLAEDRETPVALTVPHRRGTHEGKCTMSRIKTEMVGQTYGPFVRDYTFRDLELFALGCGAGIDGVDDLIYVNEHDEREPRLKVLPMFAAMLIVDSEVTRIIDYGYNYAGSLHWGFDIRFHRPITKLSDRVETKVKLAGSLRPRRGQGTARPAHRRHLRLRWHPAVHERVLGLPDLRRRVGRPGSPKDVVEMPDRAPDAEVIETIPFNQALIYRLSGDFHPQHIDWDYAAENGEPRPILHAISYAGVVMRHFIRTFIPGEPERLTRFKTRITSPVHPGSTLTTKLWQVGDNEARFALVDTDAPEAKPHLNWGVIEWK